MSTQGLFPSMAPPQAALLFPERLDAKYMPRRIADFAGLTGPKGDGPKVELAEFAAAPYDRAFVFVGQSGTGKTSMALALANEIRAEVHKIPAQACNLESVARITHTCNYYPALGKTKHLVLVDEADLMSLPAQNALLSKLDGNDPVPETIWIFTCNSTDRLEKRFLSRCMVLDFSTYGMAKDATALLARIWEQEAPADVPAPNFAVIVKDASNNVREAIASLERKLLAVRRNLRAA